MKRVVTAALFCAAFLAFSQSRAQAVTEFCPAGVGIKPVGQAGNWLLGDSTASLYGFDLGALQPRTVGGTLAFDTDHGWYTATVVPVTLAPHVLHYTTDTVAYTYTDFVSPTMYVRFPEPLRLLNAWLYKASTLSGGIPASQPAVTVTCAPRPRRDLKVKAVPVKEPKLGSPDTVDLSAPPVAGSAIVNAEPSAALYNRNCAQPEKDAVARAAHTPEWPAGFRTSIKTDSVVVVAIAADGSVADAWIDVPSGYDVFDASAIAAAKRSTYSPARAYCRAVPATYLFKVTWDPSS